MWDIAKCHYLQSIMELRKKANYNCELSNFTDLIYCKGGEKKKKSLSASFHNFKAISKRNNLIFKLI